MSFVFGLAYAVTNYLKPYIVDSYFLSALPFLLIIILYFQAAVRGHIPGEEILIPHGKIHAAEAADRRRQHKRQCVDDTDVDLTEHVVDGRYCVCGLSADRHQEYYGGCCAESVSGQS